MRTTALVMAAALLLLAASCGSDGDDESDAQVDTTEDTSADGDAQSDAGGDEAPTEDSAPAESDSSGSDAAPPATGEGGATLTLANGESFEFSVLCVLEPQMAAGSEILFTAVSYDDPGLDVTQFGDEGTVTGIGSVTVSDGSFNTLWEASTSYEAFGGTLSLTLEGSTISGSGSFYADGDPATEPVNGDLTVNC